VRQESGYEVPQLLPCRQEFRIVEQVGPEL
jgi:hypothetical protein